MSAIGMGRIRRPDGETHPRTGPGAGVRCLPNRDHAAAGGARGVWNPEPVNPAAQIGGGHRTAHHVGGRGGRLRLLTGREEFVDLNPGLSEDCAQRPFRQVAGVARHGDLPAGGWISPDFMAARPGTVECVAELPQATSDLPVPESGEASH